MHRLLVLVSACHAYTLTPTKIAAASTTTRRACTPSANLFENLGKIAEYNKKYFETAVSSIFDDREATASHILFGFAKYEDGEEQAAALKQKIDAGEITFADAAKEYSTCPSSARGGSLGAFKKGAMVPEFDTVCFDESVPFGETQGPIKTQFGAPPPRELAGGLCLTRGVSIHRRPPPDSGV